MTLSRLASGAPPDHSTRTTTPFVMAFASAVTIFTEIRAKSPMPGSSSPSMARVSRAALMVSGFRPMASGV